MIDSWDKVSINLFQRMRNIPKDDDYTLCLVAMLTGKTLDEVLEQNIAITSMECKKLAFIEKAPKTGMMKLKYKIGGTTYIPHLDMDSLTTAQYIDFQCLPSKEDSIVETLACVLIPEGKKYNTGYSKEDAMKEIGEHMSIEEALTVCDFFTVWSEILQRRMVRNFKRNLRRTIRKAPTREMRRKLREAYRELSSLGWEHWTAFLNSPEYRGSESSSIR